MCHGCYDCLCVCSCLLLETSHLKGVDLRFLSWILHMCRSLHSRLSLSGCKYSSGNVNSHLVNLNVASRLLEPSKKNAQLVATPSICLLYFTSK